MSLGKCLLRETDHEAEIGDPGIDIDGKGYLCKVCGRYDASRFAISEIPSKPEAVRRAVSYYVRECHRDGRKPEALTPENFDEIASSYGWLPPYEKVRRLLLELARRSEFMGARVPIKNDDLELVVQASNPSEVVMTLGFLQRSDLITFDSHYVTLTPAGWVEIKDDVLNSKSAFVAMSFAGEMDDAYLKGIKPAIEAAKFLPVLLKRVEHNGKICDRILAEIRQCRFVIAEFSLHRQNVYFEAGFALGLNKPVIWLCRQSEMKDAHFDTRQYSHIEWASPEELKDKLYQRIMATIVDKR